ncbi:hypothetical protein QMS92_16305 [Cronobacter sakazakii]|uniref:hypothetical protein n=1 Tax=Cronobacter sakazakii TaxID=28141 RepID=UPI000CFCAA5F|nr:hypothetical protein [Cronobacter sakazakii]EMA4770471.1 hypothetical protein [Cronobacter sakazakii]MDK1165238.1 hypothetical protein [Cronobacter sakazakii]
MRKYISIIMLYLISFSYCCMADEILEYGYDKAINEIYVKKDQKKIGVKFFEDLTGNPSYSFGFFSKAPAIITDGRSLHDFTNYTTLIYKVDQFIIDCFYSNVKSKRNGLLVKEGVCGLGISQVEGYSDLISERVNEVEDKMDSIDTSLILNDKKNFLAIIIYNSNSKLIYKLYESKGSLLSDNYSIVSLNINGSCEVYLNSPWVIYHKIGLGQIEIMKEVNSNGDLILNKLTPDDFHSKKCSTYPVTSVKQSKSYFYDSTHKVQKGYIIKGDRVNLLNISDDDKWCEVEYFSEKNKTFRGTIQCEDLGF